MRVTTTQRFLVPPPGPRCVNLTWIVPARSCSEDWDAWHARHAVKWRALPGGQTEQSIEWKVPGHIVKGNAYLPMGTIDKVSRSSSLSSVIAKTAAQRAGRSATSASHCESPSFARCRLVSAVLPCAALQPERE